MEKGFLKLVTRHEPKRAYETNFIPKKWSNNFHSLIKGVRG